MPLVAIDCRMADAAGIGTYLRHLVPRVAAARQGVGFTLLGDPGLLGTLAEGAENVRVVPASSPIYSLAEQIELCRRAPRDADLFWSPHYNVPVLRRGRRLTTVHDVLPLARPEYVRWPHRRLYARMIFRVAAGSDALIFDSRHTANEFLRLVGRVPAVEAVIYPGVSESWFRTGGEAGDRPHERPYLLFAGNVKPHKNLRGLLQAFGLVRDRIPHDLVIIGRSSGFIHGDSGALAAAAAFGDRVSFTGWLEPERVQRYFAGADALIFPSLYEGFGLPPLEAMAAGCPVIASRAASIPEVCGDAALYCDARRPESIAGAILQLMGDATLRAELVERGRERARGFTWNRCAAETWQVIDKAWSQ